MQGILPARFAGTADRQNQPWPIIGATQQCGCQEDVVPQGLQRGVLKLRRQAESLEPVDKIVPRQKQGKVGLVGEKVPGGAGSLLPQSTRVSQESPSGSRGEDRTSGHASHFAGDCTPHNFALSTYCCSICYGMQQIMIGRD